MNYHRIKDRNYVQKLAGLIFSIQREGLFYFNRSDYRIADLTPEAEVGISNKINKEKKPEDLAKIKEDDNWIELPIIMPSVWERWLSEIGLDQTIPESKLTPSQSALWEARKWEAAYQEVQKLLKPTISRE